MRVLVASTNTTGATMIEKGVVLPGSDAELLCRALAEVKTKVDEKSEARLDDTQALDALVSCFRNAEKEGQEKEGHLAYHHLLSKRLVPGTLIDRLGRADGKRRPQDVSALKPHFADSRLRERSFQVFQTGC